MRTIRRFGRTQTLICLILIPLAAWAVSWSMNGHTTPKAFRTAAAALGLPVTQACRPYRARYGARNSLHKLHKSCKAMDLSKSTPRSKIAALKKYGLCPQWHKKGYFGATGDHWHVVECSRSSSRAAARREQQQKVDSIRRRNTFQTHSTSGRIDPGVRWQQQQRVQAIRTQNANYWVEFWANYWSQVRNRQTTSWNTDANR